MPRRTAKSVAAEAALLLPDVKPPTRGPNAHPAVPLDKVPRTKGIFNPSLVGRIAGYPASAEAYAVHVAKMRVHSDHARATGSNTRMGVPDGYTRATAEVERVYAVQESTRIIRAIMSKSLDPRESSNDPMATPNSDVSRAELALTLSLASVIGPACAAQRRLRWTRLVSWLKPPEERPANMADGYAWLLNIARPGSNQSYQHPIPGVPISQTPAEREADAFLNSLIGQP